MSLVEQRKLVIQKDSLGPFKVWLLDGRLALEKGSFRYREQSTKLVFSSHWRMRRTDQYLLHLIKCDKCQRPGADCPSVFSITRL